MRKLRIVVLIFLIVIFILSINYIFEKTLYNLDFGYSEAKIVKVGKIYENGKLRSKHYVRLQFDEKEEIEMIDKKTYELLKDKVDEDVYLMFLNKNKKLYTFLLDNEELNSYKLDYKNLREASYW